MNAMNTPAIASKAAATAIALPKGIEYISSFPDLQNGSGSEAVERASRQRPSYGAVWRVARDSVPLTRTRSELAGELVAPSNVYRTSNPPGRKNCRGV